MESVARLLVGRDAGRFRRSLDALLCVGLLVATFGAYALGVFGVSGGIVVLPADATFVGLLAAGAVGYRRGGLLVAWLAPLAAYLGFRADWALLGLSGHALPGRVAYLLDPVGIAVLAAGAVLVGTAGYAAGGLAGRAV